MMRSVVGPVLILVGVGLFVFYFFSLTFSASGPARLLADTSGWQAEAGYDYHARVGLAVGAMLVVGGIFLRKPAK